MKKRLILLALLICTKTVFSQTEEIRAFKLTTPKATHDSCNRVFFVTGELAQRLETNKIKKGKNGFYKFPPMTIDGIEKSIVIKINEGFIEPDGYFETIGTKKYHEGWQSKLSTNQTWGYQIYVVEKAIKHVFAINSPEEENAFINFLQSSFKE